VSDTVLDRLVACLRWTCEYNPNAHVGPVALLWPDEGRQWEPVIDRLAERLPVVTLGEYDPARCSGPAYWIRCVVAGTDPVVLRDGVPIVYLRGFGRGAIRAVDSCPPHLAPIAELQYRGQWFSHPNNRDWSVRALLTHPAPRGVGLPIVDDSETSEALLNALDLVLDEPVERLQRLVLDADYFHDLVNPDPVRNVLDWLDDPIGFSKRLDGPRFTAFVQQCKADFGFDPTVDGEIVAARKLAGQQGKWAQVWKRFAEHPETYPGVPGQLRKARPTEQPMLGESPLSEPWPQDNEVAEDQLRAALIDFTVLMASAARAEVGKLETGHAWRRGTVWASLDQAPLAFALEQLVVLAEITANPLVGNDLATLRSDYEERGWRADDAVLRALAAVRSTAARAAGGAAVRAV
jgi:hypothetical protein